MRVVKELNQENEYVIEVTNDNGSVFLMHFVGADFYWTMMDYYDDNQFIIDEKNPLFKPLSKVFKTIREKDIKYGQTLKDNTFEWVSEAEGLPENQSKLNITDHGNSFAVQFMRNPKDIYGNIWNTCSISFCMSGSRNSNIAYAFSSMFIEFPITPNVSHKEKKIEN